MAAVGRAAPTNATVLIQGESGVGKELVARTIHRNSLRSRERFVQVNCAAIPEELIESELFGHEKGSFTGATEKQIGKFEQADRGTIFLDEVGDMSAKTQAKVLRVLQEGEVERLGSARTIKVDVRVIAATNKNLEEEIEKGHVPRGSVLPAGGDSRFTCRRFASAPMTSRCSSGTTWSTSAARTTRGRGASRRPRIEALQRSRWQGNIRELRNTVERLIIMTPGETIDVADVALAVRPSGSERPRVAWSTTRATPRRSRLPSGQTKAGTLREFKDISERAYLVTKLRENGWNISKTAEVIDTPRSNLYKKLEQYQISQETDG